MEFHIVLIWFASLTTVAKALTAEYDSVYTTGGQILFTSRCTVPLNPQIPPPSQLTYSNPGMRFVFTGLNSPTADGCTQQINFEPLGDVLEAQQNPTGEYEAGISEDTYNINRYRVFCEYNRNNRLNRVLTIQTTNPSVWDYMQWTCSDGSVSVTTQLENGLTDMNVMSPDFLQTNLLQINVPKAELEQNSDGDYYINFHTSYKINLAMGEDKGPLDSSPFKSEMTHAKASRNYYPSLLRLKMSAPTFAKPIEINTDLLNRQTSYDLNYARVSPQCSFTSLTGVKNALTTDNPHYTSAVHREADGKQPSLTEYEPTYCFGGRSTINRPDQDPNLFMSQDVCVSYSAVIDNKTYNANPAIFNQVIKLDGSLFHPVPTEQKPYTSGKLVDVTIDSPRLIIQPPDHGAVKPVPLGAYIVRIDNKYSRDRPEVGDFVGRHEIHFQSLPQYTLINNFYMAMAEGFKNYKTFRVIEVDESKRYATTFNLGGCYSPQDDFYHIVAVLSPDCVFMGGASPGCTRNNAYAVKTFNTTDPRQVDIKGIKARAMGQNPPNKWITKQGLPCMYKYVYCFSNPRGYKTALREVIITNLGYDPRPNEKTPYSQSVSPDTFCAPGQDNTDDYLWSNTYDKSSYWHVTQIQADYRINTYQDTVSVVNMMEGALANTLASIYQVMVMDKSNLLDKRLTCPCTKVMNTCPIANQESVASVKLDHTVNELSTILLNREARLWGELLGFRSAKLLSEQALVNYVCYHISDSFEGMEGLSFIYKASKLLGFKNPDVTTLAQYLPKPKFNIERGTGLKNDVYYFTISNVPTLCKKSPNFSTSLIILLRNKDQSSFQLGYVFDLQVIDALNFTEKATEGVVSINTDEDYEGDVRGEYAVTNNPDGFTSVTYEVPVKSFNTSAYTIEFQVKYNIRSIVKQLKLKDYKANERMLTNAVTSCTVDDYNMTVARSAEGIFVMNTTWSTGCQPPKSTLFLTLGESNTAYSIMCDPVGYSFVSNKYYVSHDSQEIVRPEEYTNQRASYCVLTNRRQTLTLITDISSDYIANVNLHGVLQAGNRKIQRINVHYSDLDLSCHSIPPNFQPAISKDSTVQAQSLHIDCRIPEYLITGMLCEEPTDLNLTLNFQYRSLGTIGNIALSAQIINDSCIINSTSDEYTDPSLASCVNLGLGGVKYKIKDEFFQKLAESLHTINAIATCSIGSYIPSTPMVISVTDDIARSVISIQDMKNLTTNPPPRQFIVLSDDELIKLIYSVCAVVGFSAVVITISLLITWKNKYKTARLLAARQAMTTTYSFKPEFYV